jgi:protein-S-isoprenylcysteine O-methyltransferase Ste14
MDESNQREKLGIRLYLKSISIFLVFILVTFLAAGTLTYWQGWVFNGLNILFILLTYLLLIDRKDVIKERLKPGEGIKSWDRLYYMVSTPLFFVMFIVSILDAARFSWRPTVPFLMMILGIFLYCLGQTILLWAKRTNRFFSSVVRIQHDRNQTVCTDGPYRFIRHPGYLGGLIFTIGTPLLLGSYWGLLPAVLSVIVLIWRTRLEDITLRKELPGYTLYTTQVKKRLIPYLW